MKKIIFVLVGLFLINIYGANAADFGLPTEKTSQDFIDEAVKNNPPADPDPVKVDPPKTDPDPPKDLDPAPPACNTTGIQFRTKSCTNATCKSYEVKEWRTCDAAKCVTSVPLPDCSCASSTCIGSTCDDGAGGSCAGTKDPGCASASSYCSNSGYDNGCYYCTGTKVDTSWSPDVGSYCSGYSFTQVGNLGCTSISNIGTKTCQASYCNTATSPYLYCSGSNVYAIYSYWNNTGCSVDTCQGFWSNNSCGNSFQQACGSDTCNTAGAEYEYCQDGNIWAKYDGTLQGCSSGACYNNHQFCAHYEKEVCATGYICGVVGTNDAECVAKSSTWTEI